MVMVSFGLWNSLKKLCVWYEKIIIKHLWFLKQLLKSKLEFGFQTGRSLKTGLSCKMESGKRRPSYLETKWQRIGHLKGKKGKETHSKSKSPSITSNTTKTSYESVETVQSNNITLHEDPQIIDVESEHRKTHQTIIHKALF